MLQFVIAGVQVYLFGLLCGKIISTPFYKFYIWFWNFSYVIILNTFAQELCHLYFVALALKKRGKSKI